MLSCIGKKIYRLVTPLGCGYVENPLNVTTLIRSKLTTLIRSKLTRQIRFKLTTP